MGYIDNNLMPGEEVYYRGKIHGIRYANSISAIVLGVLFLAVPPMAALFFVSGLIALVGARLDISRSEFIVTNRRVYLKRGIFRQVSLELLLSKIESIAIEQGFAERRWGYGKIIVIGTGGTREPFKTVARPQDFRNAVNHMIELSAQSRKMA